MSQIYYLWLLLGIAGVCHSCDPGKFADRSGTCLQCDISCNTCASSDGCSTCYDQMYLVAKGNLVVCEICYVVNKGCDICLTAKKCSSCEAGYVLQPDNTCVSCDMYIPNCLLCDSTNTTTCLSCIASYQLINGSCLSSSFKSGYNSIQSSQSSLTNSCDLTQVSLRGICYPSVAFCQTYNEFDGSCLTCNPIFVLTNGQCLPSLLVVNNLTSSGDGSSALTKPQN